jgi:hypothetical protein
MRPNIASLGLPEELVSSSCSVRLLARVRQRVTWVDLPMPSIINRLGCRHHGRLAALLETVVPHCSHLAAASLLETAVAHRSCLATARLLAAPHRSLLAAVSLLAASLLPPESTWVARLKATTLRARRVTANPARIRSRCRSHRTGPGCSGLVP